MSNNNFTAAETQSFDPVRRPPARQLGLFDPPTTARQLSEKLVAGRRRGVPLKDAYWWAAFMPPTDAEWAEYQKLFPTRAADEALIHAESLFLQAGNDDDSPYQDEGVL